MSAVEPLQRAVYDLLADPDGPTASVGCAVYDEVPEGAALPYVVLGEFDELRDDAHRELGALVTITVHVWSRYRGYRETARCLDAVQTTLHRARPEVDGFRDVSIVHDSNAFQRDPDPELRHGIGRFTARLTEGEPTTPEVS
ncbi:Protein of unknown function [Saccharopolyspora kobensis]|uniref:DUF3168 domain-containing protein n=1 Tax=Saccharopolyspora kobensis TaxID=146035 RepID=A0A1H6DZH2_9PSEU|nr:DUF3168 domain-containing protein [Saccharopolyspora kobensis]SEG90750.1 Protein of unknown function [Saccharopolyspora kobensis]SFD93606.1 Protein of unknown function [Saccharopolyspora kobensis]